MFGKGYKSRRSKKHAMRAKIARRMALHEEDELVEAHPKEIGIWTRKMCVEFCVALNFTVKQLKACEHRPG
jgi:hypothetical protein